jgi:hypothetical protein
MVEVEFQFYDGKVTVTIQGHTVKVSDPRYKWLGDTIGDYRPEYGDAELWAAAQLEKLGGKITKTHPPAPELIL